MIVLPNSVNIVFQCTHKTTCSECVVHILENELVVHSGLNREKKVQKKVHKQTKSSLNI
jgi:ferredoxin